MIPNITSNNNFAPDSKVWTYVAERPFTPAEQETVQQALDHFTQVWTAHNQALKATAEIVSGQIILLVVDETQAGASGCSIDKSVHFLEGLSEQLGIDFFNRMLFGWVDESGKINIDSRDGLSKRRESGEISEMTPMINTLAANLADLRDRWTMPLKNSWHNRII